MCLYTVWQWEVSDISYGLTDPSKGGANWHMEYGLTDPSKGGANWHVEYCVHLPHPDSSDSSQESIESSVEESTQEVDRGSGWPDGNYCVLKSDGYPCPEDLEEGAYAVGFEVFACIYAFVCFCQQ